MLRRVTLDAGVSDHGVSLVRAFDFEYAADLNEMTFLQSQQGITSGCRKVTRDSEPFVVCAIFVDEFHWHREFTTQQILARVLTDILEFQDPLDDLSISEFGESLF